MRDVVNCARCGLPGPIHARYLHPRCYRLARADGTLTDYPPMIRSNAEVMEDYRFLAGQGLSKQQAAERLGMKLTALRRAVQRARHREAA